MACVRIEEKALKDPRFAVLGKRMGTSRFDARGRMEEVWAYCTEMQTYYLTAEIIDTIAELSGFHELILSDEVGLAERDTKGIRIKGTRGRIEWLKKLRKQSEKGEKQRRPNGRPKG